VSRALLVYFLDVLFNPEDGGSTFLRNRGKLLYGVTFQKMRPARIKNGRRQRLKTAECRFVSGLLSGRLGTMKLP
jgi:hypothetical protein